MGRQRVLSPGQPMCSIGVMRMARQLPEVWATRPAIHFARRR